MAFDNATAEQARRLYLRFFPGEEELAEVFAARHATGGTSMAELQGRLLCHRSSPAEAAGAAQLAG